MNIILTVMAENTDKQTIDKLSDNFRGYAALLRKIKRRVLIAQQRAIYAANEEMLRMYWDIGGMLQQSQDADGWGKKTLQRLAEDLIGILVACCSKARMQTDGARKPCNGWQGI